MLEQKIIIVLIFTAVMIIVAFAVRFLSFSSQPKIVDKAPLGQQLKLQSKLILEPGITIYAVKFGSQQMIINVAKGNSITASVTQIILNKTHSPLTSEKVEVN